MTVKPKQKKGKVDREGGRVGKRTHPAKHPPPLSLSLTRFPLLTSPHTHTHTPTPMVKHTCASCRKTVLVEGEFCTHCGKSPYQHCGKRGCTGRMYGNTPHCSECAWTNPYPLDAACNVFLGIWMLILVLSMVPFNVNSCYLFGGPCYPAIVISAYSTGLRGGCRVDEWHCEDTTQEICRAKSGWFAGNRTMCASHRSTDPQVVPLPPTDAGWGP